MGWEGQRHQDSVEYDFFAFIPKAKDYYKILEVDYDATEDVIRSSYLRLALRWHPDKQKGEDTATLKFQEINEAYTVLSDPVKRRDYDVNGICNVQDYNLIEYLHRFKGLILTCNGLGMTTAPRW
uniref:J domain-containing protein n=1 Tax=Araucaria cunninghamii TaxID=56994 RepID=A0A0D6RBB2_ARACU